jgi:hypothetical protein
MFYMIMQSRGGRRGKERAHLQVGQHLLSPLQPLHYQSREIADQLLPLATPLFERRYRLAAASPVGQQRIETVERVKDTQLEFQTLNDTD